MKRTSGLTTKTSDRANRLVENVGATVQKQQINKAARATNLQEIQPEFLPDLASVRVTDAAVFCSFDDGRTLSFPVQWSDKLSQATASQRQAFDFNAHFIFWEDIDEIIGVRNILLGNKLHW